MRKIKRIKVGTINDLYGLKFYEIRHFFDNEQGEERYNISKVLFSTLKAMGVIKTFNSTKKLNEWLNSEEGKQWYVQQVNEELGTNEYIA